MPPKRHFRNRWEYLGTADLWRLLGGRAGRESREGRDGREGREGRDGREGREGREGRDGRDGREGSRLQALGIAFGHTELRQPFLTSMGYRP